MKLINKKRKLIFEFEDAEKGIIVKSRIKGNITLNDVLGAKKLIEDRLKNNGKNKRK